MVLKWARGFESHFYRQMKLQEILEAATKDGREITFNRIPDSEGDKNRGWQVDQLDAYLGNQKVGYIKLSYIPKKRFKRYYRSIFNYLSQLTGKHVLPYKADTALPSELSDEELRKTFPQAYQAATNRYPKYDHSTNEYLHSGKPLKDLTREELLAAYKEIEKILIKNHEMYFLNFKKHTMDRPLVDFISVDENFRRLGVGQALYKEAAKWMAEQGMKVYASGVQSKPAEASWQSMEKQGIVSKDRKGRRYLQLGA